MCRHASAQLAGTPGRLDKGCTASSATSMIIQLAGITPSHVTSRNAGLLLEGPKKVSGRPEKERDVLPAGLVMSLHSEPGNCPPALIQELHLSDMDGLCPSLSEGSGDTVVSQPHLSHKTLPQWSEAPGSPNTAPSNGSQRVWGPPTG